jgi:2-polyprenyl-3-methyl-5-hydroxy-6-metoxy-1,4-benzoquinol methylase
LVEVCVPLALALRREYQLNALMLSKTSATQPDMNPRQQMAACPLCRATSLVSIIDRSDVPVIQNRFFTSAEEAKGAPVGRLAIDMCTECGFVFNRTFDPDRVTYDDAYENEQGHSVAFRAHMDAMAERVLARGGRDAACVLEIGCGQGSFLSALAKRAGGRLRLAMGYDPAWRGGATAPVVRIERRAFVATDLVENEMPQVVVLRHVIEHVPDPIGFLTEIRAALPKAWGGRLFVETPDVQWIIDRGVVFDFFHEHCNYFTAATLAYALTRAGFRVGARDTVFQGQHLWFEAELGAARADHPGPAGSNALGLAARERSYAEAWRDRLSGLKLRGRIAVWGAGAKGVTFANLVDQNTALIDCLIDVNPAKQDLFIPVSGHRVVGPAEALARDMVAIVVMNPNYRAEITADLDRRRAHALVLDA